MPLVIGLVGMVATILYENYLAKDPFFRQSLFHNISSVVIYVAAAIQGLMVRHVLKLRVCMY